eukprot:10647463-Ditylum_brightwellii.AAC.1
MGGASEVVPAGHSNDLPFDMIVGGLSEVDLVEDHVYILLDRSKNRCRRFIVQIIIASILLCNTSIRQDK